MTRNYVKLSEENEWEGEKWNFWIPVDGNEGAISKLRSALSELGNNDDVDESPFSLGFDHAPEYEVDILVKHSEVGYLAFHNKLDGLLQISDAIAEDISDGIGSSNPLYKGGIRDLMKSES